MSGSSTIAPTKPSTQERRLRLPGLSGQLATTLLPFIGLLVLCLVLFILTPNFLTSHTGFK